MRAFYVSCIRNPGPHQRVALLVGPFSSHAEALARVDAARQVAGEVDPATAFDYFGTCSLEVGAPPTGRLNGALGL